MDFATSALTPGLQMFVTVGIIKTMGLGWTLALVPLLLALICVALSVAPVL